MISSKHKINKTNLFLLPGLVVLLGVGAARCTTSNKTPTKSEMSWSEGMRGMAQNVEKLMPYVFSRDEFNDQKNHATVQKLVGEFETRVNQVPQHAGEQLLGKDPIVQYSVSRLKANAKLANEAYNAGQIEFARSVLRENVGLCFSCHTTQNLGPQDGFSTTTLNTNFRISPNERADYYVATRQFDKAIASLDVVVRSPMYMLENPHEQLNALRKYLFLQVRVKKDPGPAIVLLDEYLSWKGLPYFVATDVQAWMDSLKKWQNEEGSQNSMDAAQKLMKNADSLQMVGNEAGLVDYLRASTLFHEQLLVTKTPRQKAKIYNFLGESYETLSDMKLWDLPEFYYEACIRTFPKSAEAKKCYKNFERSIILGYSGSAGIFIPETERQLMTELRALSGLQVNSQGQINDSPKR